LRILLCLVGQDEATKKKLPETANNRPARGSSGGSTRLPTQISSEGAACHRLREALGPARVPWAPAPASRRRTAPGAPRVTGSRQFRRQNPPPGADQLREHRVSSAQGSSGACTCPMGSSTRLPVQDSSGGTACPPVAPGRRKNTRPSSSKTELRTIFFSTRRTAAPGAPRVLMAPGRMKTLEPMQKT
jgi:hypothetical protein